MDLTFEITFDSCSIKIQTENKAYNAPQPNQTTNHEIKTLINELLILNGVVLLMYFEQKNKWATEVN